MLRNEHHEVDTPTKLTTPSEPTQTRTPVATLKPHVGNSGAAVPAPGTRSASRPPSSAPTTRECHVHVSRGPTI